VESRYIQRQTDRADSGLLGAFGRSPRKSPLMRTRTRTLDPLIKDKLHRDRIIF